MQTHVKRVSLYGRGGWWARCEPLVPSSQGRPETVTRFVAVFVANKVSSGGGPGDLHFIGEIACNRFSLASKNLLQEHSEQKGGDIACDAVMQTHVERVGLHGCVAQRRGNENAIRCP